MMAPMFLVVVAILGIPSLDAFTAPQHVRDRKLGVQMASSLQVQQTTSGSSRVQFTPVFDFSNPQAVESFDRIDDAIMGGISTSSIRYIPALVDDKLSYASWSGICRVDGGGFCGTRTLPFVEPLQLETNDTLARTSPPQGFYIVCRLASDNEPERRVWKVSTRTDRSRGEQLYQAEFQIPPEKEEWSRIQIPFSDFQMVRGATFVPQAEPMNASRGIYQIGLTLSKFRLAQNMTVLENFRAGYFELQIKSLGVYYTEEEQTPIPTTPRTLSRDEMKRSRPLLVKTLLPLSKLFFSEQANRRRSAMKILRTQRGLSRFRSILYGIGVRRQKSGLVLATLQAAAIVSIDTFRSLSRFVLQYGLFFPIRQMIKVMNARRNKVTTVDPSK
jgi:NADH dehydrogenase [ubiquinone] 1 alpha subcomplex assembly factor 1